MTFSLPNILMAFVLAFSFSSPSYARGELGERCIRDGECQSGECKKFQCVSRIKPKGEIGDRCIFDGDCRSDECKKYRCVANDYRVEFGKKDANK